MTAAEEPVADLTLIERARNMIAALQWAGYTYEGDWSDVTPGEGLKANLCPLCESPKDPTVYDGRFNVPAIDTGTHAPDCALWVLLQELNASLRAAGVGKVAL